MLQRTMPCATEPHQTRRNSTSRDRAPLNYTRPNMKFFAGVDLASNVQNRFVIDKIFFTGAL